MTNHLSQALNSGKKQTTAKTRRATTTGAPPVQVKMPTRELDSLDNAIAELEQELDRRISRQKYIRALAIYAQDNKININKLSAALLKVI